MSPASKRSTGRGTGDSPGDSPPSTPADDPTADATTDEATVDADGTMGSDDSPSDPDAGSPTEGPSRPMGLDEPGRDGRGDEDQPSRGSTHLGASTPVSDDPRVNPEAGPVDDRRVNPDAPLDGRVVGIGDGNDGHSGVDPITDQGGSYDGQGNLYPQSTASLDNEAREAIANARVITKQAYHLTIEARARASMAIDHGSTEQDLRDFVDETEGLERSEPSPAETSTG